MPVYPGAFTTSLAHIQNLTWERAKWTLRSPGTVTPIFINERLASMKKLTCVFLRRKRRFKWQ
jgi:hypothetical protein